MRGLHGAPGDGHYPTADRQSRLRRAACLAAEYALRCHRAEDDDVNPQPVLFIQGAGSMHAPEGSGQLAAYLARALGTDYRVIAPEMPDADNPHYQPWRDRIEQELTAIDQDVILVGHSFGGSVLLKYLAEGSDRRPVRGLFLVSVPNWGPEGWAYDEFAAPEDAGSRLPPMKIFLYHSLDDPDGQPQLFRPVGFP
jgi:uncharacterized protein